MLHQGDIIGYVTLPEDRVFNQPHEYAGAKTEVEVKAGRYPITYAHPTYNHCMFSAELPGIVVYDYFLNRFGAHTSPADRSAEIGKERSHYLNWSPMDFTAPYHDVELLDTIVVDVLDSVYGPDCSENVRGKNLTRINVQESVGLDPAMVTLPASENPAPGGEYLRGFQE